MASNIVSTTIDETFPVAGVDNDSQGFRDNFSIIKENFGYAKTEIEDLQNNTAKINANNSFANNTLSVVNFNKSTETAYDVTSSTITTDTDISFNNGHHIVVKVGANVTLTFVDWPTTDQYSEIRLHIFGDGISSRTVTLAGEYATSAVSTLYTTGAGWSGASITVGTTTSTSYLIKAFTYDSGENIYLENVGTFVEVP